MLRAPRTGVRWGVLGAGRVAATFARAAVAGGIEIVAVGSRDRGRGEEYARTFDVPRVHTGYEALLTDEQVDAVYVATPHPWHAEHALRALHADKHVLVEKPFALTENQARQILETAGERGLVALDGMWTRYLPMHRRIRQIVADGVIGDVVTVFADHSQAITDDPTHRLNDPALGGGALLDLGVYAVAFALDHIGPPVSVHASGQLRETGVDAQASILMRGASGATGLVHCTSTAPGANTAFVLGTRGRIDLSANFYAPSSFTVTDTARTVLETFSSPDPFTGFTHEMHEMQRLVESGERISDCLPPSGTLDIMRVLDEVRGQLGVVYPEEQQEARTTRSAVERVL